MKLRKMLLFLLLSIFLILGTSLTIFYLTATPKIILNGKEKITLNLNEKYIEEKAKATLFNRDISKNIKISGNLDTTKIGKYEIKYTVYSKFIKKNVSTTREITVVDTTLPEIKLKGKETIEIYIGDKYSEPGFSAKDNYDGDITKNIEVKNNINNKKAGTYEITYSVADSSNNKTEVKRKIIVKEKPIVKTETTNTIKTGYGISVLMYHYFYDSKKGETGKDNNWMEISSFEEQVKYLVENNYYFPSWSELADFVSGKITLPKKSIIITIDDGHKSLFEKAIPIIEKYNAKATAFIITSKNAGTKFTKYKSENMNFQSHTHNMHRGGCSGGHGGIFRCINYNEGLNDLKKSIEILGSADALAYPYGDCTDNVLKITKSEGFKVAFTTKYGKVYKGMDKLQLPRVRMSKGITLKGFINSIS